MGDNDVIEKCEKAANTLEKGGHEEMAVHCRNMADSCRRIDKILDSMHNI